MSRESSVGEVLACKDGTQRFIPTAWRPVFVEIVAAFANGDYELQSCRSRVALAAPDTSSQVRNYLQVYGATLVALPEESWKSSVCIWYTNHWDVLVDLWTKEEGWSDLVLKASVSEAEVGIAVQVQMVYVP